MCSEHEIGRQLVARLAASIDTYADGTVPETRRNLADALRAIAEFYSQHIWKEDNVLFPMARKVLDANSTAGVLAAFARCRCPRTNGRDSSLTQKAFDDAQPASRPTWRRSAIWERSHSAW